MDNLLMEKYEEALETLKSKGWKDTILQGLIEDFKNVRDTLCDSLTDPEQDAYYKGQLSSLRKVMDLEITYKQKLDEARK